MKKSQFTLLTQSTDQVNQQQHQQLQQLSHPQQPQLPQQQHHNNNVSNINNNSNITISQQQQSNNIGKTNYCLLIKDSIGEDKSFTLKTIQSNCSESLEFNIKSFIYQKITKNMIYKSGSFGIIETTNNNKNADGLNNEEDNNNDNTNQDINNNGDNSITSNNDNNNNINNSNNTNNTNNNNNNNNNKNNNSNSSSNNNSNNNKSFILSCFYTLIEVPINKSTTLNNSDSGEKHLTIPNDNSLIDEELILKNNKFQDELENLDNIVDFSINDDLDDIVNDVLEGNTTTAPVKSKARIEFTKEYYLCLVCETQSDVNFGMFHLELTEFCSSLNGLIKDSSNISPSIQTKLSNWYSSCIDYISRAIKILDSNLSFIIYATLSGSTFKIKGSKSKVDDIISFLKTISIVNLSTLELSTNEYLIKPDEQIQNSDNNSIYFKDNSSNEINSDNSSNNYDDDKIFSIEIQESINSEENINLVLNKKNDNQFCKKWSSKYLENVNNSIILRNLSEEMKLRVIQEFNMFRRMIDLSTLNNYILYKSFLFLKCSDNSDILLYLLKKDNIKEIQDILSVLEQQLEQHQSTNYK